MNLRNNYFYLYIGKMRMIITMKDEKEGCGNGNEWIPNFYLLICQRNEARIEVILILIFLLFVSVGEENW